MNTQNSKANCTQGKENPADFYDIYGALPKAVDDPKDDICPQ